MRQEQLESEIRELYRFLERMKAMYTDLAARADLPLAALRLLEALRLNFLAGKKSTPQDLCEMTGYAKPVVRDGLRFLKKAGYVSQKRSLRREMNRETELSPAGQEAGAALFDSLYASQQREAETLSPIQQLTLKAGLDRQGNPLDREHPFLRNGFRTAVQPQAIGAEVPNTETRAAIEEVRKMKNDPSVGKTYCDVDSMMEDLLKSS